MTRIIKSETVFVTLISGSLFASAVSAQTITATSCAPNAVAYALSQVAADGTTVVLPACPSGVGWGSQPPYNPSGPSTASVDANGQLIYTQTYSTLIQGQGNTSGSDSLGNPTGYNDQTVLLYNNNAATSIFSIQMAAGKSLRITGISFEQGTSTAQETNGIINIGGQVQGTSCSGTSGACLRIDHNHFYKLNNVAGEVYGWVYGVADHNYFDFSANDSNGIKIYTENSADSNGYGDPSWNDTEHWGTVAFFFMEDNTFNQHNASTIATMEDCVMGGRAVIRYNTAFGGNIYVQTHEVGNPYRGCRAIEVYGNNANETGTTLAPQPFVTSRSGAALVWNNTLTDYGQVMNTFIDRDGLSGHTINPSPTNYGYCGTYWSGVVSTAGTAVTWVSGQNFNNPNGGANIGSNQNIVIAISGVQYPVAAYKSATSLTLANSAGTQSSVPFYVLSPWDQLPSSAGYACLDQPGRGKGDLLSGAFPSRVNTNQGNVAAWPRQAISPMYLWSQTYSCSGCGGTYFGVDSASYDAENRDYFLELPNFSEPGTSFNGTAGIGHGTYASMPSTCSPNSTAYPAGNSPGAGYWATDKSTLYVCTATNTWTTYYTPYTYPHPLAGGTPAAPTAPTNLVVTTH